MRSLRRLGDVLVVGGDKKKLFQKKQEEIRLLCGCVSCSAFFGVGLRDSYSFQSGVCIILPSGQGVSFSAASFFLCLRGGCPERRRRNRFSDQSRLHLPSILNGRSPAMKNPSMPNRKTSTWRRSCPSRNCVGVRRP